MSLAEKLQRQHLAELTPYASARRSMSGGNVWLNANESPYAPDYTAPQQALNRYPEFQDPGLLAAYAAYANVRSEQILMGRGSDEAIDVLIRTFCEPQQDRIMICPPTYGMYAISAQTQGAGVVSVPLINASNSAGNDTAWQLDIDGIQAQLERVKIVYLCNPSNPLGNALRAADIRAVLDAVGDRALVVVDEAYIEYASLDGVDSVVGWLQDYPQLVVLRTLSKAFGLAGIRCGFALASQAIITTLQKVLAPYPLPAPTVTIAKQALELKALTQMQTQLATTQQQRQVLVAALQQLQGQANSYIRKIFPSVTNFVLLQVTNAAALVAYCQQQDVLIRNQSAQLGLENSVRISIGTENENQAVIALLKSFMKDINS